MLNNILKNLPLNIRNIIRKLKYNLQDIIEIRLRVNQPLQVIFYDKDIFVTEEGKKSDKYNKSYTVSKKDMKEAELILTENSKYALERQLREGFITIKGGHRVGFTGEVVYNNGKINMIKNITNYKKDYIYNTLIISPPSYGKTTLLRDLIRIISSGTAKLKGKKIGVVDERSELAGAYKGQSQNNLGPRTDVMDNCLKIDGMILLVRSMSPEIIVVDEIGKNEDVKAIKEVINAGISLLTTVHGDSLQSVTLKPSMQKLINQNVFQRFIILSKKNGIGTVERIYNQKMKEVK